MRLMLIIDPQVDFIEPTGALAVPGAVEDTHRTVNFIKSNIRPEDDIILSQDTHTPLQIFHPPWWVDQAGNHPAPFTPITLEDYQNRTWFPTTPMYTGPNGQEWSEHYLTQLAMQTDEPHMVWPLHCLVGTPGHDIHPSIVEAIQTPMVTGWKKPQVIKKGELPGYEYFSIFETEVPVIGLPRGGTNIALLDSLSVYDKVYMAGQALSHCVLKSLLSIIRHYEITNPEFLERIYLLSDCTSSVAGSEERAMKQIADLHWRYGFHWVKSTGKV